MNGIKELHAIDHKLSMTRDCRKVINRRYAVVRVAMDLFPGHDYFKSRSGTWKDRTWARERHPFLKDGHEDNLSPAVCSPNWWKKALEANR